MTQQIKRQKTLDMELNAKWGKIIPLSSGLAAYELDKPVIVIGRVPTCDVTINDKRLSSKHCQIEKKDSKIILTDLSTNGTYVKDNKIGKGIEIEIKNNTEIWLLPASKVKPTQALGFKLQLNQKNQDQQQQPQPSKLNKSKSKSRSKIQDKQTEKQKQKQQNNNAKKQQKTTQANKSLFQSIRDQITCAFCFQIMHGPVSVQPCNHRFCGGCLTELVNNKKGDCIKCRKQITTAVKDASFNSIIDDFLKNNPDDKRDPKQIQQLNKKNIFTYDPTNVIQIITGKPVKKKAPQKTVTPASTTVASTSVRGRGRRTLIRTSSDLSASDQDQVRCRQCMTARNGFQCSGTQRHIACFTCGKIMADRNDKNLHQYCVLCTQNFCNLYFPPCSRSGVKVQLINTRKNQSKIDAQLLRSNKFEFQSIKNFLISKKHNSKDVFDYVVKRMQKNQFSYFVDRKIMKIPPIVTRQVKLNPEDAVCDLCWKQLWFQMVFFYRTQINAQFPSSVKDRPTCYWGINCRTMDHNQDHARRYNHMVYQTRF